MHAPNGFGAIVHVVAQLSLGLELLVNEGTEVARHERNDPGTSDFKEDERLHVRSQIGHVPTCVANLDFRCAPMGIDAFSVEQSLCPLDL